MKLGITYQSKLQNSKLIWEPNKAQFFVLSDIKSISNITKEFISNANNTEGKTTLANTTLIAVIKKIFNFVIKNGYSNSNHMKSKIN